MADVTTTFAAKDESFAKTVDNLQKRLSGLEGNVRDFNNKVSSLAVGFGDLIKPLAALTAAFFGIKSAADAFFGAINKAGELNDLSARTGESVGNLAILQRAFQNAGASAESVGPMINRLQMAIIEASDPASKTAQAFSELGVGLNELKGKSPLQMFQMLGPAIASIEDPLKRTEIARALFAKGGGELIPLLRAMGVEIATARAQLGSYPEVLNRAAAALDEVGDNFAAISNKGVEFATGLLVKVAPALAEVTSKIAQIDAAGLGMALSGYIQSFFAAADSALNFSRNIDAVKASIDAMASGNFGQGLSLLFVTAKIQALSLVNEFVKSFIAGLQTIGEFFITVFGPGSALFELVGTTFEFMGKKLESSFASAFAVIFENIPFFGQEVANSLRLVSQAAEVESQAVKWYMGDAAANVAREFIKAGAAMPNAFAENRSKLQPLFDLTTDLQTQSTLMRDISATSGEVGQKLAGAADTFQAKIEYSKEVLSYVPSYSESLAKAAELAGMHSATVRDNLAQAKVDASITGDIFTGPSGIASSLDQTAASTQNASEQIIKSFEGVIDSGKQFRDSTDDAGKSFAKQAEAAGRSLENSVKYAMQSLTDSVRGLATEATLQRAVTSFERLEKKLPQPVLV